MESNKHERSPPTPKETSRLPTTAMDFSGIGSDILRLEKGLHRLHMNQTLSSLEHLESTEGSSGNDEINFKRLSHLLKQVCLY